MPQRNICLALVLAIAALCTICRAEESPEIWFQKKLNAMKVEEKAEYVIEMSGMMGDRKATTSKKFVERKDGAVIYKVSFEKGPEESIQEKILGADFKTAMSRLFTKGAVITDPKVEGIEKIGKYNCQKVTFTDYVVSYTVWLCRTAPLDGLVKIEDSRPGGVMTITLKQ